MSVLIEEIIVGNTTLKITFLHTLKVSSIVNDRFTLVSTESTPNTILFQPISTIDDYNSISRLLTLKYTENLLPETEYTLTVSGLLSATGNHLPEESVSFTTDDSTVPSYEEIIEASEEPPIEIIDYSLKSGVFTGESDILFSPTNLDFFIESTNPAPLESIVTTGFNNGRIIIKFTAAPSSIFLTNNYFKAQRKTLARGFTRWEDLAANISADPIKPWVYIDFPSIDATPSYNIGNTQYFEEGYKYRVRVSEDVHA